MMTPNEAREFFSEVIDHEIKEEDKLLFDACLKKYPELEKEFVEFKEFVNLTQGIDLDIDVPDLLPAINRRIKKKKKKSIWLEVKSPLIPILMIVILLVLMAIAFWGLKSFISQNELQQQELKIEKR